MKQRIPSFIFIPLVALVVAGTFFFMNQSDFSVFKNIFVWLIIALATLLGAVVNSLNITLENQNFKKLSDEDKKRYLEAKKKGFITTLFESARKKQTKEEEDKIIIDHGFDGIVELDNALPQWWLSLFYLGVVICVVYMLSFAFSDFADPHAELAKNDIQFNAMIKEYYDTAPDLSAETAVNMYGDPAARERGKVIFEAVCASCHQANGGGGIGPNLTDNNWINIEKDSLFQNVFYMVKNGSRNNKTMRAFGLSSEGSPAEIHPVKIQDVASYVYYMNQEIEPVTPEEGGAKPQGTIPPWVKQNNVEPAAAKDSLGITKL